MDYTVPIKQTSTNIKELVSYRIFFLTTGGVKLKTSGNRVTRKPLCVWKFKTLAITHVNEKSH